MVWGIIELSVGGVAILLAWIDLYFASTTADAQPWMWYIIFTVRFLFATSLIVDGVWRLLFEVSVFGR